MDLCIFTSFDTVYISSLLIHEILLQSHYFGKNVFLKLKLLQKNQIFGEMKIELYSFVSNRYYKELIGE